MLDKTKKNDYSIEYAHIYTNESFAKEHVNASEVLYQISEDLKNRGKSFSKVVMIDNYNPTDHILDIDFFMKNLKRVGAEPDFYLFEKDLVDYKDYALDIMSRRSKKDYTKYMQKNRKVPCSFLIFIWYLIRLGIIEIRDNNIIKLMNKDTETTKADKLINILPERYKSVEEKAMKALYDSDVDNKIIDNIRNIYI